MRFMLSLFTISLLCGSVCADVGFSGGQRPYPANHSVVFQNLPVNSGYVFFLYPNGEKAVEAIPSKFQVGLRLLAVPKDHPGGSERYSGTWFNDPAVLRSEALLEKEKRIVAYGPPTVVTTYRVSIDDGVMKCEQVDEHVTLPEPSGPSLPALIGMFCGGGLLALIAVLVGIAYLAKRMSARPVASDVE